MSIIVRIVISDNVLTVWYWISKTTIREWGQPTSANLPQAEKGGGGVSEVTGLTGKRGAFVVYDFWRICRGPTSEMGRGEWRGDGGERDEVA